MMQVILAILSTVLVVVTLWAAWHAAKTSRTPQAAVGWVVFLLAAPYLAVVVYAFLGPHRYASRARARRKSRALFKDHRSDWPEAAHNDPLAVNLRPFESVAGLPVVCGNSARILDRRKGNVRGALRGDRTRPSLTCWCSSTSTATTISAAEVAARLMAAARRGVKVWLAYDVFRPVSLRPRLLREMGRCRYPDRPCPQRRSHRPPVPSSHFRNHTQGADRRR